MRAWYDVAVDPSSGSRLAGPTYERDPRRTTNPTLTGGATDQPADAPKATHFAMDLPTEPSAIVHRHEPDPQRTRSTTNA
jgi:hypothetical protein